MIRKLGPGESCFFLSGLGESVRGESKCREPGMGAKVASVGKAVWGAVVTSPIPSGKACIEAIQPGKADDFWRDNSHLGNRAARGPSK